MELFSDIKIWLDFAVSVAWLGLKRRRFLDVVYGLIINKLVMMGVIANGGYMVEVEALNLAIKTKYGRFIEIFWHYARKYTLFDLTNL